LRHEHSIGNSCWRLSSARKRRRWLSRPESYGLTAATHSGAGALDHPVLELRRKSQRLLIDGVDPESEWRSRSECGVDQEAKARPSLVGAPACGEPRRSIPSRSSTSDRGLPYSRLRNCAGAPWVSDSAHRPQAAHRGFGALAMPESHIEVLIWTMQPADGARSLTVAARGGG